MVTRTFIDKCTTIFGSSNENRGLNPIGMLTYGNTVSRALIHFDIENLRDLPEKTKHILKLTNCSSINSIEYNRKNTISYERAASFDIILFKVPQKWDEGVGFDGFDDFWVIGKNIYSSQGCNWYQSYNGFAWPNEGIYSISKLEDECSKYSRGEESIVISRQHFDHGNENFEFDITEYVKKLIAGEEDNNGLCLAFSPSYELTQLDVREYVGFFTNNTNTVYHPVLESRSETRIENDRNNVVPGKICNLVLYANIDGNLVDLDKLPICVIDDKEFPVEKIAKGIYSAKVNIEKGKYCKDTILYDLWTNLYYNGEEIDDVEMEFVVQDNISHINISKSATESIKLNPIVSGINDNEKLNRGEIIDVLVDFRIPYTNSNYEPTNGGDYRIYIKDGKREVTIVDWDFIDNYGDTNKFLIRTDDLVPNNYFVDIRIKSGRDVRIFKEQLKFTVVSDITELRK